MRLLYALCTFSVQCAWDGIILAVAFCMSLALPLAARFESIGLNQFPFGKERSRKKATLRSHAQNGLMLNVRALQPRRWVLAYKVLRENCTVHCTIVSTVYFKVISRAA